MATLSFDNGRAIIQFASPGGARKTVSAGRIPRRQAERVRQFIADLVYARRANVPACPTTVSWVKRIGDGLHATLAMHGLIEPRANEPDEQLALLTRLRKIRAENARLRCRCDILRSKLASERRYNRRTADVPECLSEFAGRLVEFQVPEINWPCVYFLLRGSEVVYIGQTQEITPRIISHRKTGKTFDRVLAMRVNTNELLLTEGELIKRFAPCLNIGGLPLYRQNEGGQVS